MFICVVKKIYMADTAELFNLYPTESARVLQRGLEVGASISIFSLFHCCYILLRRPPVLTVESGFIALLAALRLLAALPRPFFWLRARRLLLHAQAAGNPQAVARRLIAASASLTGSFTERFLMWSFYLWLGLTLLVCAFSVDPWLAEFWSHAWMTVIALVLHRVTGVVYFMILVRSDWDRGLSTAALDAATRLAEFGSPALAAARADLHAAGTEECSICFAGYNAGEVIRLLRCGHEYHSSCIDPWLQRQRNVCPLCLRSVGDDNKDE